MPDKRKSKPSEEFVFGGFQKKRDRKNKVEFKGKIPAYIKKIASDFKAVGDVRVEKEYDSDLYRVTTKTRPVKLDIDTLYVVMKKNSIEGFFINPTDNGFYILIT